MIALLVVVAALTTACLPLLIRIIQHMLPTYKFHYALSWLPIAAGFAFLGSVFLPNIHISNETSTFQQHFVGGGIYTAFLFLYARQLLAWHVHWVIELCLLFAWVSALGVVVELGEFALIHLAIVIFPKGE